MWTPFILSTAIVLASFTFQVGASGNGGCQPNRKPFDEPTLHGGSMYMKGPNETGVEPLNVVISGCSSPMLQTSIGLWDYLRAVGYAESPLPNDPWQADVGDGNGDAIQVFVARKAFGNLVMGSWFETIFGANHVRGWHQKGNSSDSGAWFLAASVEQNVMDNHDIRGDGYDTGRTSFAADALGCKHYKGVTYYTDAELITGLLQTGSGGLDHGVSIDGLMVLLTVQTDDFNGCEQLTVQK